jgi:hypothetical protein
MFLSLLADALNTCHGFQTLKVACCYSVMAPEKRLLAWSSKSLCVVNDQPVGNPKRKV